MKRVVSQDRRAQNGLCFGLHKEQLLIFHKPFGVGHLPQNTTQKSGQQNGRNGGRLTSFFWAEQHPRWALAILCALFFLPGLFSLPPLDRDESRFAQATKQMLETGDYVEIRFQDEARNKKPVGIYWLQALPASLLSGPDNNRIWAYRLPSVVAGVIAVFLTFAIGQTLFNTRAGLIGAGLLGSSTLLVVETTIAKTDAALLAATLWAMWALACHYIAARRETDAPPAVVSYSFWAALGAGLLLKGPVVLLVVGLTALTLTIADRSARWLLSLRPLTGVLLTALIALPWFIAIFIATDGAFFAEAMGQDFGGKIVSGQESHGAPPGLYLLLLWLTFWPASLVLLPSVPYAVTNRAEPAIRFLIAWAVPSWIVMELIPTKLPHYTLPLYPALALLAASLVVSVLDGLKVGEKPAITQSVIGRLGLLLWLVPALVLSAAIFVLPTQFGSEASLGLMVTAGLAGLLILSTAALFWRGTLLLATLSASFSGLFVFWALFEGTIRQLDAFHLSENLALVLEEHGYDDDARVGIFGYSEPSFIFLNGTDTALLGKQTLSGFLSGEPGRVILVEVKREGVFREALTEAGLSVKAIDEVHGFNYSKGDEVTLTLYQLQPNNEKADHE